MSAYADSLVPAVAPHVALDRLPFVLLVGAGVVAFSRDRLDAKQRHGVALISIGMALGLVALHIVHLLVLDSTQRTLRDVTTNLVRIGSFDANLGFVMDPFAALASVVSLGVGTFFIARTKVAKKDGPAADAFRACVLLLCAGVSTAVMADGFTALAIGLSLSILATFLLVVQDKQLANEAATAQRIFLLQSAGTAALLTACIALFWGLGGAWRGDGYISDYRARFEPVYGRSHLSAVEEVVMPGDAPRGERDAAAIAKQAKERGSLTFTSHPGTRVFIDVGDKVLAGTEPFATTPFVRKDLSAGPHDVIIIPGGGAIIAGDGHEVAWIERLIVSPNEDVAIVPVGQATTFVEVDDQLGLVDETQKHFMRNALFSRTLYGVLPLVPLIVFLAALGGVLLGAPLLLVPWFGGVAPTPTWNVLRVSGIVLALCPLVRLHEVVLFHLEVVAAVFVLAAVLALLLKTRRTSWILGAATIALVLHPASASADEAKGHLTIRSEFGDVVELEYAPDGDTMRAAFVIRNDGSTPVLVTKAQLAGSDTVRHSPPFATVEIEGSNGESIRLEPGKQKRALIRWKYGSARAREFFGQVFVEANAPSSPSVLPVHASRSRDLGPWGHRALSLIIGLPLVAAGLALALRLLRRDKPRVLAISTTLVMGAHLAFVLAVAGRFDSQFARADGNEGLQFIERSVWSSNLGVEWFLGVDGVSLLFVLVTSFVAFSAAMASWTSKEENFAFHVLIPVIVSAALGVYVAQDLFVFCLGWFVGTMALIALLFWGKGKDEQRRRPAIGLGAIALAGMVFLGAAAYWLHGHSDPTHLVDGHYNVKSWSFPDLGRTEWIHSAKTLYESTGLTLIWSGLFIAFVSRLATLGILFAKTSFPTNAILPTVWAGSACYGLVRLNLGIMPVGLAWASTTVIITGVALMVISAWSARMQTTLPNRLGRLGSAYAGMALVGLGSYTPQGIAAVMYVFASLSFGLALSGGLCAIAEERRLPTNVDQWNGLSRQMPLYTAALMIAVFAFAATPGTSGFWGGLFSVVGAFPRQPISAVLTLIAAVFLGTTSLQSIVRMYRKADGKSKTTLPDLSRHEWAFLLPPALLIVVLGFSPRMLFSLLDAVILDLHRLVDAAGATQVG